MATLSAAQIKQGTTPIVSAILDGQAIQDATVYFSIRARNRLIVKSNYRNDGDIILTPVYDEISGEQTGTEIDVQLSQLETLCLKPGIARIEVGWIFEDGSADKSNIGVLKINNSLYKWVMEYGKHNA